MKRNKLRKFIELRFGQGSLGMSVCGNGSENKEYYTQRELVPLKCIHNAFIVLPDRRNIQITFENNGRMFTRTEYYKNPIDCIKRWSWLKLAMGFRPQDNEILPQPLPMDAEDMPKEEKKDE